MVCPLYRYLNHTTPNRRNENPRELWHPEDLIQHTRPMRKQAQVPGSKGSIPKAGEDVSLAGNHGDSSSTLSPTDNLIGHGVSSATNRGTLTALDVTEEDTPVIGKTHDLPDLELQKTGSALRQDDPNH